MHWQPLATSVDELITRPRSPLKWSGLEDEQEAGEKTDEAGGDGGSDDGSELSDFSDQ